ncbi:hypothetical protein, partial [Klebsiella pneumoniae]|uniref:hypothetical protein n=1 Tax=Klebsiella pneumoniae TaxID=573 RepID=UPI002730D932
GRSPLQDWLHCGLEEDLHCRTGCSRLRTKLKSGRQVPSLQNWRGNSKNVEDKAQNWRLSSKLKLEVKLQSRTGG